MQDNKNLTHGQEQSGRVGGMENGKFSDGIKIIVVAW